MFIHLPIFVDARLLFLPSDLAYPYCFGLKAMDELLQKKNDTNKRKNLNQFCSSASKQEGVKKRMR